MNNSAESFPKSAHLLKHADFDRVYRTGQRHFSPNMSVFFLRPAAGEQGVDRVRVGFSVGRALGGAVLRNRIRRRMREAVRKHLAKLAGPVDVVFNPRKSAAQVDFAGLLAEVERNFMVISSATPNGAARGPERISERRETRSRAQSGAKQEHGAAGAKKS